MDSETEAEEGKGGLIMSKIPLCNVLATGETPLATLAEIAADAADERRKRERAAIKRNKKQLKDWNKRISESTPSPATLSAKEEGGLAGF